MQKVIQSEKVDIFKTRLAKYKGLIDSDLEDFSHLAISSTGERFGENSAETMSVFCDVLSRGGKRIRGAMTLLAYEMYGGKDQQVALQAARVMELIQTYLLIVDDIYDRSDTRRGSDSAHKILATIHAKKSWKDDPHHFGESMAFNSALIGLHVAMAIAADIPVPAELRIKALRTINLNLQITGEGQSNDIYNEVTETNDESKIQNVLEWKTSYYTFVNPLQFGAILAGADERECENLLEYGIHAGKLFQITDDIVSTFGSEFESGKSPMDDIREGKRTLLTLYALNNSPTVDAHFLQRMLGYRDITQSEFEQCREILKKSGALEYARSQALESARLARKCVESYWDSTFNSFDFMLGVLDYMIERKS